NGNGTKDGSDSGLPNWTLYIDTNSNSTLDAGEPSTTTDANGNYTFTNVSFGAKIVREVQQAGYTETAPANNLNATQTIYASNFASGSVGSGWSVSNLGSTGQPLAISQTPNTSG